MGLLAKLFGGRVAHTYKECLRVLTLTRHNYLFSKYTLKYGPKTASILAPFVGNALSGFEISSEDEEQRKFLDSNRHLLDDELKELSEEPEICHIVSVAAYVVGELNGTQDAFSTDRAQGAKILRDFGILLPKESIQMPSSSNAFMRQVRHFQRWTLMR